MFGNLTFNDPSQASDLFTNVVEGDGQISSLAEATGGRFLLNSALIGTLAEYTGFKELRVRCFKPWHGRTVDIVMKGDFLMKMLTQFTPKNGLCGDNEISFLPDDTSNLSSGNCAHLRSGFSMEHVGVYDHLLFKIHEQHLHLFGSRRMECDDQYIDAGFNINGSWTYYVR